MVECGRVIDRLDSIMLVTKTRTNLAISGDVAKYEHGYGWPCQLEQTSQLCVTCSVWSCRVGSDRAARVGSVRSGRSDWFGSERGASIVLRLSPSSAYHLMYSSPDDAGGGGMIWTSGQNKYYLVTFQQLYWHQDFVESRSGEVLPKLYT